MQVDKLIPSVWGGRPITINFASAFLAAEAFSEKPPASPLSLVTSHLARIALSVAMFMSSLNGPCMAMI